MSVTAKILHEGSGFSVTSAAIEIDGKRTSECELTLKLVPFPTEVLREAFLTEAKRIGVPL
ncbi:hypothetical protein D3C83_196030 [compost metagenome]